MFVPPWANSAMMGAQVEETSEKSTGIAYVLWFFLGGFGAHRFYLGQTGTGIGLLALALLGFLTNGITWIVMGVWLLIDLLLIPGLVRATGSSFYGQSTATPKQEYHWGD
ncbi:MAG: TM2 domain-containing protein [Sphingopyxis sp.]